MLIFIIGELKMTKYEVTGVGGTRIVEAANEDEARKEAMIQRWGEQPDAVVPHAPNYKGRGLDVKRVGS